MAMYNLRVNFVTQTLTFFRGNVVRCHDLFAFSALIFYSIVVLALSPRLPREISTGFARRGGSIICIFYSIFLKVSGAFIVCQNFRAEQVIHFGTLSFPSVEIVRFIKLLYV